MRIFQLFQALFCKLEKHEGTPTASSTILQPWETWRYSSCFKHYSVNLRNIRVFQLPQALFCKLEKHEGIPAASSTILQTWETWGYSSCFKYYSVIFRNMRVFHLLQVPLCKLEKHGGIPNASSTILQTWETWGNRLLLRSRSRSPSPITVSRAYPCPPCVNAQRDALASQGRARKFIPHQTSSMTWNWEM